MRRSSGNNLPVRWNCPSEWLVRFRFLLGCWLVIAFFFPFYIKKPELIEWIWICLKFNYFWYELINILQWLGFRGSWSNSNMRLSMDWSPVECLVWVSGRFLVMLCTFSWGVLCDPVLWAQNDQETPLKWMDSKHLSFLL